MSVTAVPLQPTNSSTRIWLWLGLIVAILAAVGLAWMGTREAAAAKGDNAYFLAWHKGQPGVKTTASGLQYQIIAAGDGPNVQDGDLANVTIKGVERDGKIFQPEASGPFQVQEGGMISGFVEALKLMKKGAKYRVWIPSNLGYDPVPAGGPGDELKGKVLIFDIEVTDVKTAAEVQMLQMQQQKMMEQQLQAQGNGAAPADGEPEATPADKSKK